MTIPSLDEYEDRVRALDAERLRSAQDLSRRDLIKQEMREAIRLLAELLTNPGPTDAEVAARCKNEVAS